MGYATVFFAPAIRDGTFLPVGLETDGTTEELVLRRGEYFEDWRDSGMETTAGPVGCLNREKLHALVDAWLDGVEYSE